MEYKTQIACLLIVIYLSYKYFLKKRLETYASKIYSLMLFTSMFNLLFDAITAFTVNHLETTPEWFNTIAHQFFLLSLALFVYVLFFYMVSIVEQVQRISWKLLGILSIPIGVTIFMVIFAPIYYNTETEIAYSYGPVINTVFCVIICYVILTLILGILFWNKIDKPKRNSVLQSLAIITLFTVYQAIFPRGLTSGIGVTLTLVGTYMSLENHGEYIEKQSGIFNEYGFRVIIHEMFLRRKRFTVITIVFKDWDIIRATREQEARFKTINRIQKYISDFFSLSTYRTAENCLSVIVTEEKNIEKITTKLENRFKKPWKIDKENYVFSTHIAKLSCPGYANSETEVISIINVFATETLKKMAYIDSSTGVKNRNAYEKELNLMAQNRERLKSVWCIVIDINNLKKVNDAKGHAAGDELIRGTVEILVTSVRNTSQIYRIGGDEFVIIMTDFSKEQMENLIAGIEENRLKYNQNRDNKVSFAVGYSRYQVQQDVCLDDAIKRADAMMYKNKTNMKFLRK